jgi:hypothetical protein
VFPEGLLGRQQQTVYKLLVWFQCLSFCSPYHRRSSQCRQSEETKSSPAICGLPHGSSQRSISFLNSEMRTALRLPLAKRVSTRYSVAVISRALRFMDPLPFARRSRLSTSWDLRNRAPWSSSKFRRGLGRVGRSRSERDVDWLHGSRIGSGCGRQLGVLEVKARGILIGSRESEELGFAVQFSEERKAGGSSGAAGVPGIADVVGWRLRCIAAA